jgi:hypothetical protein
MSKLSIHRRRKANSTLRPRPTVCPDAAGIDLGATEHFVAVPPERNPQPVRCFTTDTSALHALADWLIQCGLRTVAMEVRGVYWVPLFQVLEARGLEVCLVNTRHVKNVPGRKTDVQDCQWLQYLHSVGLLHASFRPPAAVCAVRSLVRPRESLVRTGCEHLLRVQKALDQMNVHLHHAGSDITEETGLKILDAIVAGERATDGGAIASSQRVGLGRLVSAPAREARGAGRHHGHRAQTGPCALRDGQAPPVFWAPTVSVNPASISSASKTLCAGPPKNSASSSNHSKPRLFPRS